MALIKFKKSIKIVAYGFFTILSIFLLLKGLWFGPHIDLEPIVPKISFEQPVHLSFAPNPEKRLMISEKKGVIKWVNFESTKVEGILLDISDKVYSSGHEEGLLSARLDPEYPTKPFVYAFYSLDAPKRSRVSRFEIDENFHADPKTELTIIEVNKFRDTHNGGQILFHKPGIMWISFGDSEASQKIGKDIQNRNSLLGSIIRIDVSNSTKVNPYAIPKDNPFADSLDGSRAEIWAYGFRNPWRFSYDATSDTLLVADVGSNLREEVNQVTKGGNYGWPIMEGEVCRNVSYGSCTDSTLQPPLGSFPRNIARAVTGAAIYRGTNVPSLKGRIIFADYLRGIMSFEKQKSIVDTPRIDMYKWPTSRGPNTGETILISSFQIGPDNELYVVNTEGTLNRVAKLGLWKQIRGTLYAMLNFK
ncbi:MAG: PQQ-dependent sugar dehydrogenase [Bdellovibrionota bacterium]